MKNLLRYLGGGALALLLFCNVPVYQGHTALFEMRVAEAAVNPAWVRSIDSIAQLTGDGWSNYPYLNLTSYVAGKNKGGGLLYLATTGNASTTNFCTVFVDTAGNGFFREKASRLEAYDCGALGDFVQNDGPALQHGIDAIRTGSVTSNGAGVGDFYVNAGHYLTTGTLLNFGSITDGAPATGVSMSFHGAGAYSTLIQNSDAGSNCAIDVFTSGPSITISDMKVTRPGGAGSCSIQIQGNGQRLHNVVVDGVSGILIAGATDVQVTDVLGDQPNGFVLNIDGTVRPNSDINVQGIESFGGTSQTNSGGILCNGTNRAIAISGYIANFLQGAGLTAENGCKMSISSYYMDSFNNTSGSFPSVAYGIQATGTGTLLTLGTGTVTGFQSNGLNIGAGATVIDNGANFIGNVLSSTTADKYEVSMSSGTGTDAGYYKTGGRISGANAFGSTNEIGLIHIIGNTSGRLSLVGVKMDTAIGGAILVQNSAGPVNYFQLKDCDITNVNTGNSAANTPVAIGATTLATVSGNNILPANTVTSAITFNNGTNGIFTYNASHFGAFPANAGTVYSVGNVNY
jgi:hypothetical protein